MKVIRFFSKFVNHLLLVAFFCTVGVNGANAEIHEISSSNLTILDPGGNLFPIGATDVFGSFDDSKICTSVSCNQIGMTLATNQPPIMFGFDLILHDIRVFNEGTYTFDTNCTPADIAAGITNCGGGAPLTLTVGPDQLGAHILIDWFGVGITNQNVAVVWNPDDAFGSPIYDGCLSVPEFCNPSHTPTRIWDFASKDGNGDGIQGIPTVNGPFFGLNYNLNLNLGPVPPGIGVSIDVTGGTVQECMEIGGSTVTISAETTLFGGAELASIDWTVDGSSAGSGETITPFLELGGHTVEVLAITTTGESDTDSVSVSVADTIPPAAAPRFLDRRTGDPISSISGNQAQFVTTEFNVSDVCDDAPQMQGVVTPTFGVSDGDTLKIQGNNNAVNLPTTALELSVTATDASGNTGSGQAILIIAD